MKFIKNTIVYILLLHFIIASNGVLLFHHICSFCHTDDISFFFPVEHHHNNHNNQHKYHSPCCSSSATCTHNKTVDHRTKCCENHAFFIKIEDPFSIFNDTQNIIDYSFIIPLNLFYDLLQSTATFDIKTIPKNLYNKIPVYIGIQNLLL